MTAGTLIGAVLQVVAVAGVGWVVSQLLFATALKDRIPDAGLPERALAAVVGFVGSCVVLMIANVITGGVVFGIPVVVPLLAIGLVALARRKVSLPRGIQWAKLLPLVALLLAIYVAPAVAAGSGVRTGDPPWHLGWTEQLLAGEAVPTGPAPQVGRNAYPWGWHAVLATATRLVPGTTPLVAHEAMHLLIVLAIPLAAACIARRVVRASGWWAAGAASLVGGFGWVLARGSAFITSPSQAEYGADLVVASPNSVYELFPTAAPREFGLIVLGAAAMFIVWAVGSRDRRLTVAAGVVVGIVGLVSVPLFVSALGWLVAAFFANRRGGLSIVTAVGVALVVFGFWAGPVVSNYLRYGGFVDITPRLGEEWPLFTALGSWGLLLPFGAAGVAVVWVRRRELGPRALLSFGAATAFLLALAIARAHFDWTLAGNATLLHQGRVWPPAHLLGAAFAGIAAMTAFAWLSRRSRAVAASATAVALVVGSASPVLAAQGLGAILEAGADGFVYASPDLGPDSFVSRASEELGPDDVVQVEGSNELAFLLFQFSGCRLARYDHPQFEGNDLRIRYTELAESWDERMAGDGFRADYLVLPAATESTQRYIVTGDYRGRRWVLIKLSQ